MILIFLNSCKKDDKVIYSNGNLIGTWTQGTSVFVYLKNGKQVDTKTEPADGTKIEFKSNGTYTVSLEDGTTENGTFRYNASARLLEIKADDESKFSGASVLELTANKMVVQHTEPYTDSQDADTEQVTITMTR